MTSLPCPINQPVGSMAHLMNQCVSNAICRALAPPHAISTSPAATSVSSKLTISVTDLGGELNADLTLAQ